MTTCVVTPDCPTVRRDHVRGHADASNSETVLTLNCLSYGRPCPARQRFKLNSPIIYKFLWSRSTERVKGSEIRKFDQKSELEIRFSIILISISDRVYTNDLSAFGILDFFLRRPVSQKALTCWSCSVRSF